MAEALNLTRLLEHVERFAKEHRRDGAAPFEVSALYDLHPQKKPVRHQHRIDGRWPHDDWPHGTKAGVYCILGDDLTVAYIGKASLNSTIKGRLNTYFKRGQTCVPVRADWTIEPRFVLAIAVPDDRTWEAPALEEYLLVNLGSIDNTHGNADE